LRPGAPDGGASTTLLVLGGAAVVLLVGASAGLMARRSGRAGTTQGT